jgi:hypothetical protein
MRTFQICTLAFVVLIVCRPVSAQTVDTTKHSPWTHTVVGSININEASYTNWTAGGENALAYAAILAGKSEDNPLSATWTNSYKLLFGQARLGDHGLRKTDDEISLESLFKYKLDSIVNPYFAATFKSQFAPGYTYDARDSATQVSKFFDPGYFTETVGAIYAPSTIIKTRLGVGLREILTTQFTKYADDPSTPKIESTLVQGGMESVTELALAIDENILLASKLEIFAPFEHFTQMVVRSESGIAAKITKLIVVNLNALILNDPIVTPRTQVKQSLSIGVTYTFL